MNVARAIRQIYEKRPYPAVRTSAAARGRWLLPPLPWMKAIWQRQHPLRRILIAGCGTGSEAFTLCRQFSDAEIVAIDFSSRSIRAAKDLQRKNRKLQRIRFVVCDLINPRLPKIIGDNFDLVSCHGVLSYIPRPGQALKNFGRCLATDGVLYLGVNGEMHFSRRWRPALPGFGRDVMDFQDSASLRQLVKLFDTLSGHPSGFIAEKPSEYVAGDLFGPLIQNWPLRQWTRVCRAADLHLLGSYSIFRPLRAIFQDRWYRFLIPRSRAKVAELSELLMPSGFHRLILSRQPEVRPPWKELDKLQTWRPARTQLYRWQWPQKTNRWLILRNLKLKSPSTNTLVELPIPEWQIELLRRSTGKDSISDILQSVPVRIPGGALRDQLYLLYQLCAINLLPPAS